MERLTARNERGDLTVEGKEVYAGSTYNAIALLEGYENTGLTPEEVQELKERDTAKTPMLEGDGCDKDGNIIYDTWICPNCEESYEIDYDRYDFCPKCGQRLKWED